MPSRILRLWNPDIAAWEEVGDSRLTAHLAAPDPHSQYLTTSEADALFLTPAEGDARYLPVSYVPPATDVTITGTEGVTVVESPANTFALGLTASPDANNTIEVRANGLYAASGAIPPEYVTDSELATALGPYATDADLAAHAAAGDPHPQYLTAAELPAGADVTITTDASLTSTESPANTFALATRLSPDAGNALSLRGNGLYGTDTTGGGGGGLATDPLADAKGDLFAASGNDAVGRLPLGTNGHVLTADSAQPLGVKWAASGGLDQATADARYVNLTGDQMSGALYIDSTAFLALNNGGQSTTGAIRLRREQQIGWRNAAALGNVTLSVDASDRFTFSSDVLVSEATPTVSLQQAADTQPRSRLTDTALGFGPGGTTAPDATLQRTGAGVLRLDTHLGVSVAPAAWHANRPAVQVGGGAALAGDTGGDGVHLWGNTYLDAAAAHRALVAAAGTRIDGGSGGVTVSTAPSVAAGAAQTFTTRMALAQTGTLTLTPDAGQAALAWGTATRGRLEEQGGSALVTGGTSTLFLGGTTTVAPSADNTLASGWSSNRWTAVYAVAGTINTSSREAKEGITPLDPALALEAVRSTPAVTFTYTAPEKPPEWYELPDDPEQAQAVLEQRLTAAPLEAAARQQAGFIAEEAHPLFLTGEGQTNPSNTSGVLLAALQALDARITALETP